MSTISLRARAPPSLMALTEHAPAIDGGKNWSAEHLHRVEAQILTVIQHCTGLFGNDLLSSALVGIHKLAQLEVRLGALLV